MKFLLSKSGSLYLALTLIGNFFAGTSATMAQISNTASASGDNLPAFDSNTVDINTDNTGQQFQLIKTADRAAAEPGDTIVYRLSLKNVSASSKRDITITDNLPLGLNFIPESLQGSLTTGTTTTKLNLSPASISNRTVTFTFAGPIEPEETLNIVYAAVVTPDAIRGTGRNTAQEPRSNIASYLARIRPGILSDCGTLFGRVFVDKNFDGEQQPGEPGVPNAVVIMDDGNRITTDADGVFSLANVISGHRTGTLDLTSLPGYTLAPNLYFIERNSQSRLVRLSPGGLARMNFAVTPAYGEEELE